MARTIWSPGWPPTSEPHTSHLASAAAAALSAAVVERATQLRATHGLRTPDALQAACCLQLGPDAVMITGDAGFQRLQALQVRLIACSSPPI